jgi:cobalt-zinc-cadmium efflux system protein
MIVEFIGGWLTNSLALISDAGHMLNDAAALGLGFFAVKLGEKPPSMTKTFGYRRVEILAALLNGLTLWVIVGMILHEAWLRMQAPQEIRPVGMMAVAAAGLVINLLSAKVLHSHKESSLNVKGAFLHVMADTLGSLGAVVAGAIVWKTGWTFADPLMSFAICALILASSWGFLKESVHVLMLGVPSHLEFSKVEGEILATEGVCCVYDLHIWSIQPGTEALSAHVVITEGFEERERVLRELTSKLKEKLGIGHVTLQLETSHESLENHDFCTVPGARGKCVVKDSCDAGNDCGNKDHPRCRHHHPPAKQPG